MDYGALLLIILFIHVAYANGQLQQEAIEEPPEGYYAFVESPNATPPKVRPPPYERVSIDCIGLSNKKSSVSVNNLCGDLNKGKIPKNPMLQNVLGEPYPFELIRNHTLKFLSKTLPVLKADDTLPKVTQMLQDESMSVENNSIDRRYNIHRIKRSNPVPSNAMPATAPVENHSEDDAANDEDFIQNERASEQRKPRKFCDGGGVFCSLYRAIQGEPSTPSASVAERREELGPTRYEGPPTPCPAKVEYVTPVFAKNYQGSWRYVVQIPYEGYFTQTLEVTHCVKSRCHYLDGGCLSSPRWVSILVAEIFYPNAEGMIQTTSSTTSAPSVQDFQAYQQYLQKRAGVATASDGTSPINGGAQETHCDGNDEIGCFQVRLYFDWFLIPGSCKCWRPDYFAKYVRRKSVAEL